MWLITRSSLEPIVVEPSSRVSSVTHVWWFLTAMRALFRSYQRCNCSFVRPFLGLLGVSRKYHAIDYPDYQCNQAE
jgi:hypothetical protein